MWADEAELDAARHRVDGWESAVADRATRARALSARLAGLTATAHSADRTVEATVDSSGALVDLRLDERTRAQPAARTAAQVLTTTRKAYAELLRQVTRVTEEMLGPDDPAGPVIVASYGRRLRTPGEDGAGAGP
ncbi:YbaB/EbfC family nucleoid-associated protein [Micromonospora sp. NPDC050200]|uniref:YbaB/EbfC family nucleoid-associated protein n=1 Tax=Micromonospora sp. NPDC050200 TaxID=3155664 RepID=UPI0033CBDEE8